MANCVNCKTMLSDRNIAPVLYEGAHDRLCVKCFGMIKKETAAGKIKLQDLAGSRERIAKLGLSAECVEHLRDWAAAKYMTQEQRDAMEADKLQRAQAAKIDALRASGRDGYYEYKVVSLLDVGGVYKAQSGQVDVTGMEGVLNQLGFEGWELVAAYSNEAGKNVSRLTGVAVNATIDENVLIFKRYIKV